MSRDSTTSERDSFVVVFKVISKMLRSVDFRISDVFIYVWIYYYAVILLNSSRDVRVNSSTDGALNEFIEINLCKRIRF